VLAPDTVVLEKVGFGTLSVTPAGELWAWSVEDGDVVMTPDEWAEAGWTQKREVGV
jgi:hypothetical protein